MLTTVYPHGWRKAMTNRFRLFRETFGLTC
jgi:hypothetical protein